MNLIIEAAQFASKAHAGQKRKYNGDPYIYHPMRVAGLVMTIPQVSEYAVAAAICHDVKEDCPGFWPIPAIFPIEIVRLIEELTNPSKDFPNLNREDRKAMDREHLRHVSRWAKIIKLLDRTDNLRDMAQADRGFKRLYLNESSLLASVLTADQDVVIRKLNDELMYLIGALQWTV